MTYDENTPVWCMHFPSTNEMAYFFSDTDMIESFYISWSRTPRSELRVEHKNGLIEFYKRDSLVAKADVSTMEHVIHSKPTHL